MNMHDKAVMQRIGQLFLSTFNSFLMGFFLELTARVVVTGGVRSNVMIIQL